MSATITQKCQSKNLKKNKNLIELEKVEMILGSIKVLHDMQILNTITMNHAIILLFLELVL